MSLAPGVRLGACEILGVLGAGGMGEVYRARDTKLNRHVALKILPEAFAIDADRLARFKREAQILASLNHANIATIYGLEETDGVRALVLELVEGPTLADRIAEGPIPLEDALPIARQIAEALEAAHEQGIIHRDLKPSNIKIRSDGTVKVLDFGLAKALEPAAPAAAVSGLSMSPTITSPAATNMGVILGTAAYMSPEQARGKPVDRRTDIWAFGCVLYEMLTRKRAFEGEDVTDTLSRILQREPDLTALSVEAPLAIRRLLARCLERNQNKRLSQIAIAGFEIEQAMAAAPAHSNVKMPWLHSWIPAVAVLIAAGCLALGIVLGRFGRVDTRLATDGAMPVTRTVIELPPAAALSVGTQVPLIGFESPSLALSPDGRHLIYVGQAQEGTRLYYRDMNSLADPRPLPGTEGALFAFFSPDGDEIGFLTPDRLKKTSSTATAPTTLCRARTPIRANWLADDIIYFTEDQGATLSRVAAAGGDPTKVFSFPNPSSSFDHVLPDGRAALVTSRTTSISTDYSGVHLFMIDGHAMRPLIATAYDARYLSSGHVMFARAGSLVAVPFDLKRLEVTGREVQVVRDVGMESIFGNAHVAASDAGMLVYVAGGDFARGKVAWLNRSGERGVLVMPDRVYGVFDVSPDNHRVAATVADVNDYIWIWDDRSAAGQVLATGGWPRWDSSGQRVAFLAPGATGYADSRLTIQDVRGGTTEAFEIGVSAEDWSRSEVMSVNELTSRVGVMTLKAGAQPKWIQESRVGFCSVARQPLHFLRHGPEWPLRSVGARNQRFIPAPDLNRRRGGNSLVWSV